MGGLRMVLFQILAPSRERRREGDQPADPKSSIARMEQIYSHFLAVRGMDAPRVALEIASRAGGREIELFAAVPRGIASGFEKFVQGAYPQASVRRMKEDYTIFIPGNESAGGEMALVSSPLLPVTTYRNLEEDPLAGIANAFSKVGPEEGAALQIILQPVRQSSWQASGRSVLRKMEEDGVSAASASLEEFRPWWLRFLLAIPSVLRQARAGSAEEPKKKASADPREAEAVREKLRKPILHASIRFAASAGSRNRAEEILEHLESQFSQFSLHSLNSFRFRKIGKGSLKRFLTEFSFRAPGRRPFPLNVEELSTFYHIPSDASKIPYLAAQRTAEVAPPTSLPAHGELRLGMASFRGEEREVWVPGREDRRRHFYVVGQTGTGKSSFLLNLIVQDIARGEGVGVLDPHGDLIEDVLARIPRSRSEDVVLFEPFDTERPFGLNMLEYETPEQKDFAVQEMIAIFHKLFPPEIIGPMFEHYMRNVLLALMADPRDPGTLVEIPRMFTDDEFMERRLQRVRDPLVRDFWMREWRQLTGSTRSDLLGYIVSKVGRFIENETMRNIIGQQHSSVNLGEMMDQRKIFLANLSKGRTGEINSSLLGLILVSKLQMAAMRRASVADQEARRDFYLYVDEFQNFTTDSIASILSEARKYRLNLILAHQYIPQLSEEIKDAVMGNAGTMGAFRVGAEDAEFLEKQFGPEFSAQDLVNLDNFTLVLKMLIEGSVSSPFQMHTLPSPPGNRALIRPLKSVSKLTYGKPRELVEREIAARTESS